jgi:hypothetical protein
VTVTHPDPNPFDALRDAILRGIAHALSNRVAALGGIGMLVDPGDIWTERLARALGDEAKRLEDILRLMRLLPDDGRGDPGAVELQPLVPDVISLHAYNSALLQVECAAVHDRETVPVFANRPRLVHALLLAIDTAKRHAMARGARVAVSYGGDAERVLIRVATESSPAARPLRDPADDSAAAFATVESELRSALARTAANFPLEVTGGDGSLCIQLTIPTLAAGRRGERDAAAARSPA